LPAERAFGAHVRARIAAPPERLWAIVADPARHPELAGSREPRETRLLSPGPLAAGCRFESRQKWIGIRYTSRSEVAACDEPRLLRWTVDNQTDWEFRFEPVDTGNQESGVTQVTHSYRWTIRLPGPFRVLLGPLISMRNRTNARGMVGTLRNLARLAGAPEPTNLHVSHEAPAIA
jgi:hypothetical protein